MKSVEQKIEEYDKMKSLQIGQEVTYDAGQGVDHVLARTIVAEHTDHDEIILRIEEILEKGKEVERLQKGQVIHALPSELKI